MRRTEVDYKPSFLREFKRLESALQEEAREKIELFKDPESHPQLRIHALKGRLAGYLSFSVNYRYRIIFTFSNKKKNQAVLLAIGDHDVYR